MPRTTCQTVILCGVFVASDAIAQSAWPRVVISGIVSRAAVTSSVEGAARRLQDTECSRILAGWRGSNGQLLGTTLAERAPDWTAYVRSIYFCEGVTATQCQRRDVVALTAVKSRVVFICANAFLALRRRSIWHAEAVIIHEVLHTLGLPDRNDKNGDITEQVLRACRK